MRLTLGDPDESFEDDQVLLTVKVIKREKHAVNLGVAMESADGVEDVLLLEVFTALLNVAAQIEAGQKEKVLNELLKRNRDGREYMNKDDERKAAHEQHKKLFKTGEEQIVH